MRLSPPVPWRDVPPGAIVLYDGPRKVLGNTPLGELNLRTLLLEGVTVQTIVHGGLGAQLVLLDEADAIATLGAAGLNPEVLD